MTQIPRGYTQKTDNICRLPGSSVSVVSDGSYMVLNNSHEIYGGCQLLSTRPQIHRISDLRAYDYMSLKVEMGNPLTLSSSLNTGFYEMGFGFLFQDEPRQASGRSDKNEDLE